MIGPPVLTLDYIELNKKLEKYCSKQINVEFADVWSAMIDEEGVVFQDIFVEDGDHMKPKGYTIWIEVIGEFLSPLLYRRFVQFQDQNNQNPANNPCK